MSRGWSRTLLFSWIFPFWFSVWSVDYKRLPGETATDSGLDPRNAHASGHGPRAILKSGMPSDGYGAAFSPPSSFIPRSWSALGERTHFREGRACLEVLYAVLSHHLLERQVILAVVHVFAAEADLAEEGTSLY